MKEDYLKTIDELKKKIVLDNKNITWVEMCDILEHLEKIKKILEDE